MMKVKTKKETCPQCGSTSMEDLVRIEEGQPIKVYVRCAQCKTFVSRYTVSTYTSDRNYESLLRLLRVNYPYSHDGRSSKRDLEAFSEQVKIEFEETVQHVEQHTERRLIVEMLEEKKDRERSRGSRKSD